MSDAPPENRKRQSPGEELANSLTHGIGTALSIAALVILVRYASLYGNTRLVVSFGVYGATLIILYLASTLYHGIVADKPKQVLRMLDHTAIYLLIAGSYTPVTLVFMRGVWGWSLFGAVWALAVLGILMEFCVAGIRLRILSVCLYILMGWLVVIAFGPMSRTLSPDLIRWLVTGGIVYTLGVIFYVLKKLPYHHAVWHLFVLGGSACHFFGFFYCIAPQIAS